MDWISTLVLVGGFFCRGIAWFVVVTWISYSLSSRNKVLAMGPGSCACLLFEVRQV